MGGRHLSRWQKASAVIPVALMVGAWGAALTNDDLATASKSSSGKDPGVPEVPTTAFEQPASVQSPNSSPTGIDPKAGANGTLSTLSSNGIPAATLLAYKRTETLLGQADSSCKLPWTLVAAIGRVESNHGRYGGNRVGADGVSTPGIYGIPLDGSNNTARITDTDSGILDRDKVFDRAVGPMQFIPSTWKNIAVDGNNDDKLNPQDINDAALATGVYLCSGEGDLSTPAGASAAVLRYNRSSSYVKLVLSIAARYAQGDFTQTPNNQATPTTLTDRRNDMTLPASQRNPSKSQEKKKSGGSKSGGGGTSSGGGSSSGSGGGSSSSDSGGGGTAVDSGGSGDKTRDQVNGTVDDTTDPLPAPVKKPVQDLWTKTEATLWCTLHPQPLTSLTSCIGNLVGTPQ